jgi:alkanesulfonate monooxygenase SsuD/methylene tetrahydromethanopterin reductase-like flavin-dependent oxidoreductase (luciferase family)
VDGTVFLIRFDMRAHVFGAPPADLYDAAIEMSAWAESHGCAAVILCEHHGSPDGYLPSPLILASAIASRTQRIGITVAAAILPFYDPVRLAEDMNVLDLVSRGRVSYVLALGYRPEEYEHFGLELARRGAIADQKLDALLSLRKGEPVGPEARRIRVTPGPFTPGGPTIMWGGGSLPAARRAGRNGLGLVAQRNLLGMKEAYEQELRVHGHEPGLAIFPEESPTTVFVADDVDAAWEELGPFLLHDAMMYGEWNPDDDSTAGIAHVDTVEDLRHTAAHCIMTPQDAREVTEGGRVLTLAPLCGGIPPVTAWPYLERAAAL